jgi:hypothetical protein
VFYPFAPNHAFFLPNLLLVVGAAGIYYKLCQRLLSGLEAFLLAALFIISYHGVLCDSVVIPWNTTPTLFLSYAIFFLVALKRPKLNEVYLASVCLAAIYLFRPAECICMLPPVVLAVLSLPSRDLIIRAASVCAAAILFVVGTVLCINLYIFGSLRTPYDAVLGRIGLAGFSVGWKTYFIFVDGGPVFREPDRMLLAHFPWLLLALPGLIYLLQRYRSRAVGMLVSIALSFGLYLSYNDLWPTNLYRYILIHYLAWTFPLLALITYVGIKQAVANRVVRLNFVSTLFLVALLCLLHLQETTTGHLVSGAPSVVLPATRPQRIDWVLLHGATSRPKLVANDTELLTPGDFETTLRPDGYSILVSARIAGQRLEIVPAEPREVSDIEFGQLCWTFGWSPTWVEEEIARYFVQGHVVLLGKVAGVDLAGRGPNAVPDGVPDEVIDVQFPNWAISLVTDWRVEADHGRGGVWVSKEDHAHWAMKIDRRPELQRAYFSRVTRLCLGDDGSFERPGEIQVQGLNSSGRVVVESTARR